MSPDSPESFSISESADPDGVLRLRLHGELDLTGVEGLSQRLEQLRAERRAVLLDLSELEFIDSAGVQLLVTTTNDAREDSWRLELTRPHGEVERVLQLTGLTELLPFAKE